MPYREPFPPPHKCELPIVPFDEETAKQEKLSSTEVKRRWPRGHYTCPDCGISTIVYASYAHYIWGDW